MEALTGLLPIVLFIVLFWFILIRPQQKRQKQVREMQNNLQKVMKSSLSVVCMDAFMH